MRLPERPNAAQWATSNINADTDTGISQTVQRGTVQNFCTVSGRSINEATARGMLLIHGHIMAAATNPAATAAALPPDDPPGVCSRDHGLRVWPNAGPLVNGH